MTGPGLADEMARVAPIRADSGRFGQIVLRLAALRGDLGRKNPYA